MTGPQLYTPTSLDDALAALFGAGDEAGARPGPWPEPPGPCARRCAARRRRPAMWRWAG
ncbi:hypothetical protein [Fodinicurvata halophila]|uniref:hypothetical protein n=1 Tax=Fodinicurvata halophila TaxID=1419723 RepID=UPI003638A10D